MGGGFLVEAKLLWNISVKKMPKVYSWKRRESWKGPSKSRGVRKGRSSVVWQSLGDKEEEGCQFRIEF